MILEHLSVHGFSRAFAQSTAVLDFTGLGPGVYAWCGPNGAGKTTAMESVVAALYREFPSYGYGAARHVAPGVRDAAIELVFMLPSADGVREQDARYRARLLCDPLSGGGRGKSEHYLDWFPGDVWSAVSGPNVRETDAALASVVPSRNLFLAGPFAAQRGAGSFWSLEKADRKRLFVELLGHGTLQLLHGRAAEQAKACGVDLEQLAAEVERLNELAIRRAGLVEQLAALAETLEESTEAVLSMGEDVSKARRAAEDARAAVTVAETEHKAASQRFLDRCQSLEIAAKAVRDAEAAFVVAQRAAVQVMPFPATGAVEEARAEVVEREAAAAHFREVRDTWQRAAAAADQAIVAKSAELDQHDRRTAELEHAAELAGVDLELDICRRCPLTARARAAAEQLDYGARQELVAAVEEARRLLEETTGAAATAGELLEAAEADLTAARAAERQATDDREAAARQVDAAAALERCRTDLEQRRAARDEAQAAAHAAAPPEPPTAGLHLAAQDAERVLHDLEQQARVLDDARREAERDHARVEGELAGVDRAIGGADIHERQDALHRLQARRRSWQLLDVGLGPNGVQALEIDAAGPEVSALANGLLMDCYGPRFQIRLETTRPLKSKDGQAEVFECAVIDAEADHTTHAGSGGEMVIVEEALRLALAIYSTRQSGKECLTLFRDEAAGALDQWPGRDSAGRYLAMLRAARERGGFHHVHFIAHQPALFEAADGRFVFGGGAVRFEEG